MAKAFEEIQMKRLGFVALGVVLAALAACRDPLCTPGETQACLCEGSGESGVQTCADDGMSWGQCACGQGAQDAGPQDSRVQDSGAQDAGSQDSGVQDSGARDSGALQPDGDIVDVGAETEDGARTDALNAPCPCPDPLVPISSSSDCVCRAPCSPAAPVPRCDPDGFMICAQISEPAPDGGAMRLDAGACLPSGRPGEPCSPAPCGEVLVCARRAGDDDNTCRYRCNDPVLDAGQGGADAATPDVTGLDLVPLPGACPPGQACTSLPSGGGLCF